MTTFINMLGSDVWSDADITNRTEAILRGQFSTIDETVMNRRVTGAGLGEYVLSEADMDEIAAFGAAAKASEALGVQARADMALLQTALDYEAAERRLALPQYVGPETIEQTDMGDEMTEVPNPAFVQDCSERDAATEVLASATQETLELVALRRPPEPVEPEATNDPS